jgi:hypothetical protein
VSDEYFILFTSSYLKIHDERPKRLWFLWTTTSSDAMRCGCVGGCAFFGSNRNGPKFFKNSAQDLHENINIARYQYVFPMKVSKSDFNSFFFFLVVFTPIPRNTVSGKVFCMLGSWCSTHHPTVYSQCRCKSAMST